MADVLDKIKAYIDEKLPVCEAEQKEIDEMKGDEFNAMDASGGNFDDAYELGNDHGDTYGRLMILRKIKAIIEERD